MTRKSAAKFKPVKTENSKKFIEEDLPPIEETFDKAKQAFINTADVAVTLAERIDNLVNIRNAYHEYWHEDISAKYMPKEAIRILKELQGKTIECYANIARIVRDFKLEDFLLEDMPDYFDEIMPKCDDVEFDKDLFEGWLLFGIVKPWGERMNQLHYQMLDEAKARKEIDDE